MRVTPFHIVSCLEAGIQPVQPGHREAKPAFLLRFETPKQGSYYVLLRDLERSPWNLKHSSARKIILHQLRLYVTLCLSVWGTADDCCHTVAMSSRLASSSARVTAWEPEEHSMVQDDSPGWPVDCCCLLIPWSKWLLKSFDIYVYAIWTRKTLVWCKP